MKSIISALLVTVVLLPAAQVKQDETGRGADQLINTTLLSIQKSANANHGHTWIKTAGFNFAQRYELQKELQSKGYDFDMPMVGSTYVGW